MTHRENPPSLTSAMNLPKGRPPLPFTPDAPMPMTPDSHPRKLPVFAALLLVALAAGAVLLAAGALRKPQEAAGKGDLEKLFFALRIEAGQQLVARPNLIGETGSRLTMQLVDPERPDKTRLSLEMLPTKAGASYDIQFGLTMPAISPDLQTAHLTLAHGEEKTFRLPGGRIPLTVTLLLMRVDSPEFDAWRELVRREQAAMAT